MLFCYAREDIIQLRKPDYITAGRRDLNIYILLSRLTPEGRKTVKERPGRIREVDRELEKFGVKVIDQYATLGHYDFVNIVEAPDNETIGQVSIELCSRGTLELTTLAAVSVDSIIRTLSEARAERQKADR